MNARQEVSAPLRDHYDVVVVGARCAGAATAMLLARAGLSVLAVERSAYGSDTLSTHALTKPAVLQLSRWGVLDRLREQGTPRVNTVAYHYGGDVVEVPIAPLGDVDGLYAPRRSVLDRVLVDAAAEAGAHVLHRTRVTDLLMSGGRVRGVVIDSHGHTRRVQARLVIGADGARSFVAGRVGARFEHRAETSSACVYAFVPGLPEDAYVNHFRPGVSVGVIPTNQQEANVWVAVPMDRLRDRGRRDLRGFLGDQLQRVDPVLAVHVREQGDLRVRGFAGLPGFTRQAAGNGWALVGDAVYFKDPLSAHGITDALIGAELVSRAAIDLMGGTEESRALGWYAARRAALTSPMRDAVIRLSSFAWSSGQVQQIHLEMNRAMRDEWAYLSSLPTSTAQRAVAS